jgi:hypothetical protein
MLTHPTLDLLHNLGLHGMAKGFKALKQTAETRALEHAEWLGLLLEHEVTLRRQKRFEARARTARLRHNASVEDIDCRAIFAVLPPELSRDKRLLPHACQSIPLRLRRRNRIVRARHLRSPVAA